MSASCSCYQTPVCWWFQGFSVPHKSWTKGWFSKLTPRYKLFTHVVPSENEFWDKWTTPPKETMTSQPEKPSKKKRNGAKIPFRGSKNKYFRFCKWNQNPNTQRKCWKYYGMATGPVAWWPFCGNVWNSALSHNMGKENVTKTSPS